MDNPFSWQNFDRISGLLESVGYMVAVLGPIFGLGLLVFGCGLLRWIGIGVVIASVLIATYHLSFSLLMNAIRDLTKHLESLEAGHPKS